jgi:hypothetical protein
MHIIFGIPSDAEIDFFLGYIFATFIYHMDYLLKKEKLEIDLLNSSMYFFGLIYMINKNELDYIGLFILIIGMYCELLNIIIECNFYMFAYPDGHLYDDLDNDFVYESEDNTTDDEKSDSEESDNEESDNGESDNEESDNDLDNYDIIDHN